MLGCDYTSFSRDLICGSANGDITSEHGVYDSEPQAMVINGACVPDTCNKMV